MVALLITLAVMITAVAAEALHAASTRRVAGLAFGPKRRPAPWTHLAAPLRVSALGSVAWGLTTLLMLPPNVHHNDEQPAENELQHMLLVLDVSPSMRLVDAGPGGKQSRKERGRDLLESLFSRIGMQRYRVTVLAVYNGVLPVVEKTRDIDVIHHILDDLPMHYAFPSGGTDLLAGLKEAARIAQPWRPKSTTLLLLSDGDTVSATGMPQMPASIARTLVVGVGNPQHGTFIDGHNSRQDASTLRQIAARVDGTYHNGNEHHIGSEIVNSIAQAGNASPLDRLAKREYALLACAVGAFVFGLLPELLQQFGTRWKPGVQFHARVAGASRAPPRKNWRAAPVASSQLTTQK